MGCEELRFIYQVIHKPIVFGRVCVWVRKKSSGDGNTKFDLCQYFCFAFSSVSSFCFFLLFDLRFNGTNIPLV